jgi:hypothetical protein
MLVVDPKLSKNVLTLLQFHHIHMAYYLFALSTCFSFNIGLFCFTNTFDTPFLRIKDSLKIHYDKSITRGIRTNTNSSPWFDNLTSKLATYNPCTSSHQAIFWHHCRGAKHFWYFFLVIYLLLLS